MEYQKWYEKYEKDLFKDFADLNGVDFNLFCDREFERSLDK